jgi:hypothetical protein
MLKYEDFVKNKKFDWATMGEGRIIPRSFKTTGNNNNFFQPRPKIFVLFKSYTTPSYLLTIVFPKFDPLTVTGKAFCADLGPKCQYLFCLV